MGSIDIGTREVDASRDGGIAPAAYSASDLLCLAAAPTFAAMALLTVVLGGPGDVLCAAEGTFPLGGMTPMYLLMSAFHMAPWLKLIASRPSGLGRSRPD